MNLAKWVYRGGRPNWLATMLNRGSAVVHTLRVAPNYLVTLEVPGPRSGRMTRLPLVMVLGRTGSAAPRRSSPGPAALRARHAAVRMGVRCRLVRVGVVRQLLSSARQAPGPCATPA
jgi:hypothetical protein